MIKNKLAKIDIAKDLSSISGYSLALSKHLIDDVLRIISQEIKKGNFILKNIGTFKLIAKAERQGRNPKTNVPYIIKSRKSLSFSSSKKLINNLKHN